MSMKPYTMPPAPPAPPLSSIEGSLGTKTVKEKTREKCYLLICVCPDSQIRFETFLISEGAKSDFENEIGRIEIPSSMLEEHVSYLRSRVKTKIGYVYYLAFKDDEDLYHSMFYPLGSQNKCSLREKLIGNGLASKIELQILLFLRETFGDIVLKRRGAALDPRKEMLRKQGRSLQFDCISHAIERLILYTSRSRSEEKAKA